MLLFSTHYITVRFLFTYINLYLSIYIKYFDYLFKKLHFFVLCLSLKALP